MSAVERLVTRESLARDILLKLIERETEGPVEFYNQQRSARDAVAYADALLAELAKAKEGP